MRGTGASCGQEPLLPKWRPPTIFQGPNLSPSARSVAVSWLAS
jgi:hypothetical protein